MSATAYLSNDNILTLTGLQNSVEGTYINSGAIVDVTVVNSSGTEVSGQSWPTTMNYVAASNGEYNCTISDSITWTRGYYVAKVTADAGAGLRGYWELDINVAPRKV